MQVETHDDILGAGTGETTTLKRGIAPVRPIEQLNKSLEVLTERYKGTPMAESWNQVFHRLATLFNAAARMNGIGEEEAPGLVNEGILGIIADLNSM